MCFCFSVDLIAFQSCYNFTMRLYINIIVQLYSFDFCLNIYIVYFHSKNCFSSVVITPSRLNNWSQTFCINVFYKTLVYSVVSMVLKYVELV